MYFSSHKGIEAELNQKLPQEFSPATLLNSPSNLQSISEGLSHETLLMIAANASGSHRWQIDPSPSGLEQHIGKLKRLGFSLGPAYSVIDDGALDSSRYQEVNLVAIIPILFNNAVTVPFVVQYQRQDSLSAEVAEIIGKRVREDLGFDANSLIVDRTKELTEHRSNLRYWAGMALGTASVLGVGVGAYSAIEPVGAIVSGWRQDQIASDLADLKRVHDYLKLDSLGSRTTLEPIKARHYESLARSFNSIFADTGGDGRAITDLEKAELLCSMIKFEVSSGRGFASTSSNQKEFFRKILYQVIEEAPSSEARALLVDALFDLVNPNGPPGKSAGIWASFGHYLTSSERANDVANVKELARVDSFLLKDSTAPLKTLAPLKSKHYRSLVKSLSPDADPVVISRLPLSQHEMTEILIRLIKHEVESNRGVPVVGNEKSFFQSLLWGVIESSVHHETRVSAGEALRWLVSR